jgi:hypothetical protein
MQADLPEGSSRPEEFHLQSPSDPYVNLSIHTAPASHALGTLRSQADAGNRTAPPSPSLLVGRHPCKLPHPLRSSPITGSSSLLQDDPPPFGASILSPFVVLTYRVFSYHHRTGSHVPHRSLNQGHATFMPGAARPISRLPPCRSRGQHRTPVLTSPLLFRHLISGSLALISLILICHSLVP